MSRQLQKHKTYLEMASTVSKLSKDERTKVGAVIVDVDGKIVSVGYNGPPKGITDSRIDFSGDKFHNSLNHDYETLDVKKGDFITQKNDYMIHAELNAILNTDNKRRLKNAFCYITHYPCNNCANTLVQVGIKEVHILDNKTNSIQDYIRKSLWALENGHISMYIYDSEGNEIDSVTHT